MVRRLEDLGVSYVFSSSRSSCSSSTAFEGGGMMQSGLSYCYVSAGRRQWTLREGKGLNVQELQVMPPQHSQDY